MPQIFFFNYDNLFFFLGSTPHYRRYCATHYSCRISAFGSWQTRLVNCIIFVFTKNLDLVDLTTSRVLFFVFFYFLRFHTYLMLS